MIQPRLSGRDALEALAHPIRIEILMRLCDSGGEASAVMLARELAEPAPKVAYHVDLLRQLGAVVTTRTRPGRRGGPEKLVRLADDKGLRALIGNL